MGGRVTEWEAGRGKDHGALIMSEECQEKMQKIITFPSRPYLCALPELLTQGSGGLNA